MGQIRGPRGGYINVQVLAAQSILEGIRTNSTQHNATVGFHEPVGTVDGETSSSIEHYERMSFINEDISVARKLHSQRPGRQLSSAIYILGADRVGKFMAHALAGLKTSPPVTLLSHRRRLCDEWHKEGQVLELIGDGKSSVRSGVDFRHIGTLASPGVIPKWAIDKLIVTTKSHATIPALLAIKDLLLPSSTVCFLQNGMGIIDDVNSKVFPNPATRPQYITGLLQHTIRSEPGTSFTIAHHRPGQTYLSVVPRNTTKSSSVEFDAELPFDQKQLVKRMSYGWNVSARGLMRCLNRAQILGVKGFEYKELLQVQLERLAVNAVLGPLSVTFDCANGKLLQNVPVLRLIRDILEEIISVIRRLPELRGIIGIESRLGLQVLESLTLQHASRTRDLTHSMLQDVRRARRTEVDFINGYFVKRGLELGIKCPVNSALIEMVKGKQTMVRAEKDMLIPFHRWYH